MDRLVFSGQNGQVISSQMFGIKLERSNGPDNPGRYTDTIDSLSATSLRFSFDVDKGVEDGRPISVAEAISYSAASRIPVVLCILTDNLFHSDTDSNPLTPRSINQAKILQVKAFVKELLAEAGPYKDVLPNAAIQAIELGNEYWGLGGMTSLEYGELVNVLASAVQDSMEELGLAASSQPKILAQMGSAFSYEFSTTDSTSPYFGLTWQQATERANLDIISQISNGSRQAIDGLVEHYYWNSLSNTFRFDSPSLRSIDVDWSIWASRGYEGKELHITEWNNKLNNPSQFGLKGAGVLLEMFENMVRLGVDAANIWPLQHNHTRLLDTLAPDGSGALRLTPRGAIFEMMAESLPGTRRIDGNLTTANGYAYELNGYSSDDHIVFFISSRVANSQIINLDLSAAVGQFPFLKAELVSYDPSTVDGYFMDGSTRIAVPFFQDPDALVRVTELVYTGSGRDIQFNLGGYEVVRLVYSNTWVAPIDEGGTQNGTPNSDSMSGTHFDDTLAGQGEDDLIEAYGGNDRLFGGSGRDTLIGGDGDDTIDGGSGGDVQMGGGGDDLVYVNHIWDSAMGGNGQDELRSSRFSLDIGSTSFRLFENARVTGTSNLNLTGNSDANVLWGNDGSNVISGGNGDDRLLGEAGGDKLFGGHGGDRLFGGAGSDIVHGGSGHDTLIGGPGSDTLYGGLGNDIFVLNHVGDKVVDTSGIDHALSSNVSIDLDSPLLSGVENARITGSSSLNLTGNSGVNMLCGNAGDNGISGGGGDDRLFGGGGGDKLFGDVGNDHLFGGASDDIVYGGSGQDTLVGSLGSDTLYGGAGNDVFVLDHVRDRVLDTTGVDQVVSSIVSIDLNSPLLSGLENAKLMGFRSLMISGNSAANTLQGNDGSNRILGQAGGDIVAGGLGNDSCFGGTGLDTISGEFGSDLIYGGAEHDELSGGAGNDTIFGDDGSDRLAGGRGKDYLIGGSGRDTFIFKTVPDSSDIDVIVDFHPGSDRIAINNSSFEELNYGWLQESNFQSSLTGEALDATDRIMYSSANGRLYYDPDGSGPEARITFAQLAGNLNIAATNIYIL